MDVRLSPEQVALRESVTKAVARLGPRAVADLDDADRRQNLDGVVAAAGWRELRSASDGGEPWASAVEAAIVAAELGSRSGRHTISRAVPGRRSPTIGRRAAGD